MRQLKIVQQITNRDSSTLEKYFNDISREGMLTQKEEVELAKKIKQGDQVALNKLVKANLRFVVSVAKQYHNGVMPLNDLINEGNIGLIKAAQMFDETKGFKFISYAVWWIRQSILKALDEHSRIVRIPANKLDALSKIKQASAVIEQLHNREPTQEELADFLEMDVEQIIQTKNASVYQSSLDAPFGDENNGSLLDVISNPDATSADAELANKNSLQIEIGMLLSTLSDREQYILKKLFAIGCDYTMQIEDIAEELGISRERVRQIKEKALDKIRTTAKVESLKTYVF